MAATYPPSAAHIVPSKSCIPAMGVHYWLHPGLGLVRAVLRDAGMQDSPTTGPTEPTDAFLARWLTQGSLGPWGWIELVSQPNTNINPTNERSSR